MCRVRVLIVEDEVELAALTPRGLRGERLLADVAIEGEDAPWMASATTYDVCVGHKVDRPFGVDTVRGAGWRPRAG